MLRFSGGSRAAGIDFSAIPPQSLCHVKLSALIRMHTSSSIHPGVSQPTAVKARMVCTHGSCCHCQNIAANMRFAGLYFVRIPLVVCVAVVVLLTVMVAFHPEMHRILNWSPLVPDEEHSLAGKQQLEATVGGKFEGLSRKGNSLKRFLAIESWKGKEVPRLVYFSFSHALCVCVCCCAFQNPCL